MGRQRRVLLEVCLESRKERLFSLFGIQIRRAMWKHKVNSFIVAAPPRKVHVPPAEIFPNDRVTHRKDPLLSSLNDARFGSSSTNFENEAFPERKQYNKVAL